MQGIIGTEIVIALHHCYNTGGFLTKVGLFFKTKDQTEKVFVEIRETDIGGTPKNKVVQDFARVGILPADITVSTDGTTETVVNLPSPLYLQADTQYSLTLSCPTSDDYEVWVGETNQPTVATQNYPAADQVIYSNQYTGGNLYKPQNGLEETPIINPSTEDPMLRYAGTPAWGVTNFLVNFKSSEQLRFQAGLENIFDLHYRTFASGISAPGRSVQLGLRYNF